MTPQVAVVLLRLTCELLLSGGILVAVGAAAYAALRWLWSLRRRSRAELLKIGARAALGPITGPLAARVVRNARKGRPIVAAVWALTIPLSWAGIASAATLIAHATGH